MSRKDQLHELAIQRAKEKQEREAVKAKRKEEERQRRIKEMIAKAEAGAQNAAEHGEFSYGFGIDSEIQNEVESYFLSQGFKVTYAGDGLTVSMAISWK